MARFFLSATALAALCVALVAAKPMSRLQATTRQAQANVLNAAAGASADMLPAATPDPEVEMIRDAMRNGLDVMKVFSDALSADNPAMQPLLGNKEMMQRIVKEIPVIKAFQGFKEAVTAETAEETRTNFAAGMKAIVDAMPKALKTMKDPTISTKALSSMLTNDKDGSVAALFAAAEGGNQAAMEQLSDKLNGELYPMFDTSVFKEIAASNPLGKLTSNQEIMRIISEDPIVEAALTNPENLDAVAKKVAARRRFV